MRPRAEAGWLTSLLGLALLTGCGAGSAPVHEREIEQGSETPARRSLESVAVARGLVVDPAAVPVAGLYGIAGGSAADRLCIARDGRLRFSVRFGEDEACTGRGTATQDSASVVLRFDDLPLACTLTARFDGARILLPGRVDPACDALCSGRASLAGVGWQRDTPIIGSGAERGADVGAEDCG